MSEFIGYLVWVNVGDDTVSAYKCYEIPLDMNEKEKPYLSKHKLTQEEMNLSLNVLMKRYPYVP
jgi:hypothetical protein